RCRGEYRRGAGTCVDKLIGSREPARGQIDCILELISAGLTRPEVSNAMIGEIVRPSRRDLIRTALRAFLSNRASSVRNRGGNDSGGETFRSSCPICSIVRGQSASLYLFPPVGIAGTKIFGAP